MFGLAITNKEVLRRHAPHPLSLGMYEFWYELLQGEEESPTIRFKGNTERYSWKQNAETIEVCSRVLFSVLAGGKVVASQTIRLPNQFLYR